MTTQEKNIQLIKDMFATFKKGDAQALINYVAEDCDWWSPVTNTSSDAIPWATPRHGRGEVSSLFSEIFTKVKPIEIKPEHYTAQEDYCIVEGSSRGLTLATGCEFYINWVMVCTLRDGKITRFRNYFDTADLSKALMGTCEVRKAA
jgi:ketosteroid isomerase-like protein